MPIALPVSWKSKKKDKPHTKIPRRFYADAGFFIAKDKRPDNSSGRF